MKNTYVEQSLQAVKTAIEYELQESEARKNDEHEMALHCFNQAKYYRGQ
jgi:hypothetical protein